MKNYFHFKIKYNKNLFNYIKLNKVCKLITYISNFVIIIIIYNINKSFRTNSCLMVLKSRISYNFPLFKKGLCT